MQLPLGARHRGERMPRSAGSEGCCGAGAARADIRATALTAHQARGLPQAGGHVAGWNRRRQCEVHLQDPVHLAFRAQYLANAESWKDSRAVHDSRGQCSERGPFLARSSRGVFLKGDLRGFSDTRRAYLAKASSFWMHGARILPGRGTFPVRGPFGGAWSEKIATDCCRERIAREYCHCQSAESALQARVTMLQPPEDASQAYAAMPDCPRTHRGILPTKPHFQLRKSSGARSRHVSPEPIRGMRRHRRPRATPVARWSRRQRVTPAAGLTAPRGD